MSAARRGGRDRRLVTRVTGRHWVTRTSNSRWFRRLALPTLPGVSLRVSLAVGADNWSRFEASVSFRAY